MKKKIIILMFLCSCLPKATVKKSKRIRKAASKPRTCLIEVIKNNTTTIQINEYLSDNEILRCRKLMCPQAARKINCIDPEENNPDDGPQDGAEMNCCTMLNIK